MSSAAFEAPMSSPAANTPASLVRGDPFPASPRVSSYVPLASHEQVLSYLAAKVVEAPGVVELSGSSGVGKSLLMRVLAQRLADRFRAVHVPIPSLSVSELATWVENQENRGAWHPGRMLGRLRAGQLPRVLFVEDAQLLSEEARRWIEGYCDAHDARAVLALTEEVPERSASTRRAFLEPLELSDVDAYLEAHLAASGAAPEVLHLFRGEAGRSLALQSRGVPRAIHRLADERLLALAALRRAPADAPAAVPERPHTPTSRPPRPPLPTAQRAAARQRRRLRRHRRDRGYFLAGVAVALFMASLTFSVPSPLADGPARPAPLANPAPSAPFATPNAELAVGSVQVGYLASDPSARPAARR